MKTYRSWWLMLVVLLLACSSDPDGRRGSRLGAACTEASSVTRAQLEAGAVLCEHQTLVFPIHPGDDAEVSFRVLTEGDVDLCFDDDDAEAHEASLRGTSVAAQTPCQTVSLPAGDHTLGLRHALRDAESEDTRPDVLHTRWTPPTKVSRGRLQVTSNACRGCVLKEEWPVVWRGYAGYTGDYTAAVIVGPCPKKKQFCQLGGFGVESWFDRATIELQPDSDYPSWSAAVRLGDVSRQLKPSSFREASLSIRDGVLMYLADATAAKVYGDGGNLQLRSTKVEDIDLSGYLRAAVAVSQIEMSLRTYAMLRSRPGANFVAVTVTIPKGQSLAGAVIEGVDPSANSLSFSWPLERGILSMPGASFEKATLRNLTIPCPHGGNLRGASFAGATLDTVSLTGCDLTDARFAGSTLTNVTAASKTLLIRADLTNVKVNGLNVTEASLSEATLGNAPSSAWTGLVARQMVAGSLHAQGLVTGLDGNGRGPDFSLANLASADFSGAQLPRAVFTRATLTATNFVGATLVGSNFDFAKGDAPRFGSANLDPSSVAPTSMSGVRFVAPSFPAASLKRAKLTYARVCGGDFEGIRLQGADLTGTLLPLADDTFSESGTDAFQCSAIKDLTPLESDATTTCPDGSPGPCSDGSRVPVGFAACPANVQRKNSGFPCAGPCECTLLTCINGTCG